MARNWIQNETRNINRRIGNVAKNLGTESPIYQDYVSQLEYLFPNNLVMKNGVVQLARPMELNPTDIKQLNIEGIAQIEKGLRSSYKAFKQETGSSMSLAQYVNAQQNVAKNLGAIYGKMKDAEHQAVLDKAVNIMRSSHKTHEDIVSVGNIIGDIMNKNEEDIDWFGIGDLL